MSKIDTKRDRKKAVFTKIFIPCLLCAFNPNIGFAGPDLWEENVGLREVKNIVIQVSVYTDESRCIGYNSLYDSGKVNQYVKEQIISIFKKNIKNKSNLFDYDIIDYKNQENVPDSVYVKTKVKIFGNEIEKNCLLFGSSIYYRTTFVYKHSSGIYMPMPVKYKAKPETKENIDLITEIIYENLFDQLSIKLIQQNAK